MSKKLGDNRYGRKSHHENCARVDCRLSAQVYGLLHVSI
jgi:hypothetical protein